MATAFPSSAASRSDAWHCRGAFDASIFRQVPAGVVVRGTPATCSRPRQAYALGLIPVWARLASRAPGLANFASHAPLLGLLDESPAGSAT